MRTARTLSVALALVSGAVGCNLENPGRDPKIGEMSFPIALAISPGATPTHLFVVSSNFDLRYNAGTLQSVNLDTLRARIEAMGCAASNDPCTIRIVDDAGNVDGTLLSDEVRIDSYASSAALSADGSRLYIPVRSTTGLLFVDVTGGAFTCTESPSTTLGRACDSERRVGDEASATERGVEMPPDPVAVRTGSLGVDFAPGLAGAIAEEEYVLVAHRGGQASLFFMRPREVPKLIHVLRDLPTGLSDVEIDPVSHTAWMPSADQNAVARVGVQIDATSLTTERSFLYDAGSVRLLGLDDGQDTRGVAFDPRPDVERAYIVSRRPEAVLEVDLSRGRVGEAQIDRIIDLGVGPSRIATAMVEVGGSSRLMAFVSCFDTRDLYIIDLELGRLLSVARGLSGPFEIAFDPSRNWVYVADFRSSVVRVVDLGPLVQCLMSPDAGDGDCAPRTIALLGEPRPVETLR